MLLNGELVHNGHPVLQNCAANAVTTMDGAGNRKLDKERANGRIDLIVAAVMAAGIMSQDQSQDGKLFDDFLRDPIIS
jgi:phage terminase large subunit-like protein